MMNLTRRISAIAGVLSLTSLISFPALSQLPNVSRPDGGTTTRGDAINDNAGDAPNGGLRAPNPNTNPSPITPSSIGAPTNNIGNDNPDINNNLGGNNLGGNGSNNDPGGTTGNNVNNTPITPVTLPVNPGIAAPGTVNQPAPGTIVPANPNTPNPNSDINSLNRPTGANGNASLNQPNQQSPGNTGIPNVVRVVTPDSQVVISSNAEDATAVQVVPDSKNALPNSTLPSQTLNLEQATTVTPVQPIGSLFPRNECQPQEIYVNLPLLGGGACLSPAQMQNLL